MFTLHTSSHLRFVRAGLALSWVLLAMTLAAQAQTQADCTFKFFSTKTQFKHQDGTPVFMQPLGINDFRTIVGYAIPGTSTGNSGLLRWANGGVTRAKGTSALVARNDHGSCPVGKAGRVAGRHGTAGGERWLQARQYLAGCVVARRLVLHAARHADR